MNVDVDIDIWGAIRKGNMQRLRELVAEHGVGHLSFNPTKPTSSLHYAVEMDNFEAVKYLLDNGVDINWGQPTYLTPLEALLIENEISWEMVEYLVSRGAILGDRKIQWLELSDETFQKFTDIFDFAATALNIKG